MISIDSVLDYSEKGENNVIVLTWHCWSNLDFNVGTQIHCKFPYNRRWRQMNPLRCPINHIKNVRDRLPLHNHHWLHTGMYFELLNRKENLLDCLMPIELDMRAHESFRQLQIKISPYDRYLLIFPHSDQKRPMPWSVISGLFLSHGLFRRDIVCISQVGLIHWRSCWLVSITMTS